MDATDRLSGFRDELVRRLGAERAELWVGSRAALQLEGQTLQVRCGSEFECAWLRRRLHGTLKEALESALGPNITLRYVVDESTVDTQDAERQPAPQAERGEQQNAAAAEPAAPTHSTERPAAYPSALRHAAPSPVRPERCTFARFVEGESNALAVRSAQTAATHPGRYCPLLIYGPNGVGKTHLLRAIADRARGSHTTLRVTAEQFTGEFLQSLDSRTLPSFRQKFRTLGILLVDDVHFLAGKKATLDEALHTLDTLQQLGRQVVLTADRGPGELKEISPDLASRIAGGLAVAVDPPDFATRAGIVRAMAGRMRIELNDEVIDRIAAGVAGSARLIAGAMNRLLATSQAHKRPIDTLLAEQVVAEFTQQTAPPVKLADIQRAVCEVFGVEPASLKSGSKARVTTQPRMVAMWLARKYTRSALTEIGDYFGRRSHSTVISAQQKVDRLVSDGETIELHSQPVHVEEALRRVESVLRSA